MSDDDSPEGSGVTHGLVNPHMTHMASQVFDRLISHSKFAATMLDMSHNVLPLPEAAQKLKLQLPLISVLPLVDCQPNAEVRLCFLLHLNMLCMLSLS